jgi:hypothetical protein
MLEVIYNMDIKTKTTQPPKKLKLHLLIPLILLGIYLILLAAVKPARFMAQSLVHKITSGQNIKNYDGISDVDLPLSNNVGLTSLCKVNLKYSTDVFKEAIVTDKVAEGSNNTQITLVSNTNSKDSINMICLKYNLFSTQLRSLVEASWLTNPESEKKYGLTLEKLKDLSPLEFYKKYTLISNDKCVEIDGLSKLQFVSTSIMNSYQNKYIECDLTNTDLRTKDYILFPNGNSESLLLVRFVPFESFKDKVLIF